MNSVMKWHCDQRLMQRAGVRQGGAQLMLSNQGERCYKTPNQHVPQSPIVTFCDESRLQPGYSLISCYILWGLVVSPGPVSACALSTAGFKEQGAGR